MSARLFLAALIGSTACLLQAQFVAFNDHDGWTAAIHPFTTTYSFSDYGSSFSNVVQGRLRNIIDGEFVDAQVRIEYFGYSSFPSTNGNTFAPGTPAALIFGCVGDDPCFADFRDNSARVGGSRSATHTFSDLNPARKYQFIGTGMGELFTNDTTRYTITGAVSFVNAHTSNCVTQSTYIYPGTYSSNIVIVPTGRNHEPGFGDMAVWNDIRVGTNGSFTVVSSGNYGIGSPINGFRLVEDFVEPTPPFVSRQPANVNASRNSTQRLAPILLGSLPLSFQWYKGSTVLPNQTNRVLTFAALQPEDAGTYWLAATNPYGTVVTSNATVSVANEPVALLNNLQGHDLRYGNPLSFSVSVTGTPPRFFQWFKSGVAIPGAQSNTFQIGAVNLSDAGTYSVLVSNLFSFVWSADALVTVTQAPLRIVEQPQSITVTQGTTLRVQAAVAGSAPRFQWFRNGTALANATSSAYRVPSPTTNNAGDYFVVATGPMNAVTSTVASVTVVPPAPPPQPPTSFPLLALTNVWAYDQSGNELGTAWREVNYDDSSWLRGRGVLGIEPNGPATAWTNTVLRLTNYSGQPIITSYFRTHFSWPTNTIGAALLFSNLIDDGAIFYVNGVPLFRQNMPEGMVTWSTFAPVASLEGAFVLTNLAAPIIVEGDNVLAVEVHQVNATSSDIVFGTAVFGYNLPDEPFSIVASPRGQTVHEGQPLELNFLLSAPARFQWYRDGIPLNSPYGPNFFVGSATPSDAGQYFAIATNSLGAVTSAVAVVEVIADTQPPRVLSAVLQTNRMNVIVEFDERLVPASASNSFNYRVLFSDGSDAASVVSATYSNLQVSLSLSTPPPENTNLVLWLDGITDRAAASNRLDGLLVPLRQFALLVPLEGDWKYNDTGADLGTAWRETFYDDSLWPSGPAVLYNDNAYAQDIGFPPPPFFATNTFIQLTNEGVPIVTHYFRRSVDVSGASPLGAQLSLQTLIDDGAVMYLNGSEFFRLGVTNNPVYAANLASRSRGASTEALLEGPFVATPTNVVPGSNTLAVEVHQLALVDVSFGAEVSLLAKSFTNEPVRILRQPVDAFVREGQPFTFEVDSIAAANAQWLKEGNPVPSANSETLVIARAAMSDNGARFSVVLSNAFSFVLSSNATLHVVADTNPPALLSASAGQSLTQIVLSFSEPIDAASASNPARYTVRDGSGQWIAITGVSVVNESNVVVTTAPRLAGRNYEVRVEGVRDVAAAPNEIEPGSGAMLGYEQTLVPLTATWAYDQSGNGQFEAWKSVGFDDSDWPRGEALLYNDTFATAAPAVPLRTLLSQTNALGVPIVTHYFRHTFNLPSLDLGAALSLRHAVDDGVVIYLNGAPVLRTNVPAGGIDATTLATSTVVDAALIGSIVIDFAGPSGTSVLAAETHQATAPTPSDVAFAAELSIARPSTVLPPIGPALRITRIGGQVQLSWNVGNYVLESATAIDGIWSPVQGATSPLPIQASEAARFYRLRKP